MTRFHPKNRSKYRAIIREDLRIPESSILILFVGSGFERKGLKALLRATQHFRSENWRLLIVGKGKWSKYLKFIPANLRSKVLYKEPTPDIEKYYSAADIFALPSIYEPFGNANLEALASGLPVITTRNCGSADIIQHGQNGLIVETPESSREIAKNINILFNQALRRSMGQKGRVLAEKFSIKQKV